MASFATIRLVAVVAGTVNLFLVIMVFSIPFWRKTEVSASSEALGNIWAHEGLWVECFSFYGKSTQCGEIGSSKTLSSSTSSKKQSSYYQYGIYAYLTAYRTFMVIAFVSEIIAVGLSAAAMKCNTALAEEGRAKQIMNVTAGFLHLLAGIMTCVACSWYASQVKKEQSSPFYQTVRLKYVFGACLYMGWISSGISLALGCLLTFSTCFNRPVEKNYGWRPPVSEIQTQSQPPQSVRMAPDQNGYPPSDDWSDGESRYTSSKRSHRSHRSHRSGRSSHKSHRTEKKSRWVDDYDQDPHDSEYRYDDRKSSRYDDGFV